MKLPYPQKAVVEIEKLRDYCLNANHPRGKHKARVFAAALGFTVDDADRLRTMILAAAGSNDATAGLEDEHGKRFTLDFDATGLFGIVSIRTAWIIDAGAEAPRLITCYIRNE